MLTDVFLSVEHEFVVQIWSSCYNFKK